MNQFGAEFFPKNKFFFSFTYFFLQIILLVYLMNLVLLLNLKSAVILSRIKFLWKYRNYRKFKSRDHTENMLKKKKLLKIKKKNKKIKIFGKKNLNNFSIKCSR